MYDCDFPCNTSDYEYDILNYFDNCTTTINSTNYIITVLSPRHSKHTDLHVSAHAGLAAAMVTVIII